MNINRKDKKGSVVLKGLEKKPFLPGDLWLSKFQK